MVWEGNALNQSEHVFLINKTSSYNEMSESGVAFHHTCPPCSAPRTPVRGGIASSSVAARTQHHYKASQWINSSWLTFTTTSPDVSVTSVNKQDRNFRYSAEQTPDWLSSEGPTKEGRFDWLRCVRIETENKEHFLLAPTKATEAAQAELLPRLDFRKVEHIYQTVNHAFGRQRSET